jgi:transposase-like protein
MSRRSPFVIVLSDEDRYRLVSLTRKQTAERRMVVRACIVLAAADGEENASIAERLDVALNTVIKWRRRFFEEGIDGLADRKRSGRPRAFPPSGSRRDQRVGLRAAGHHRRSVVALELRRVGVRAGPANGGGGDLGGDGVAGPASRRHPPVVTPVVDLPPRPGVRDQGGGGPGSLRPDVRRPAAG